MGKEAPRNVGNRGPLGAAVAANEADAFVQLRSELWRAFAAPETDCEPRRGHDHSPQRLNQRALTLELSRALYDVYARVKHVLCPRIGTGF